MIKYNQILLMTENMTEDEIINKLINIFKNINPNTNKINQNTKINTHLSSLDLMEFAISIEDVFGIILEAQNFQENNTIGKIAKYISNLLNDQNINNKIN